MGGEVEEDVDAEACASTAAGLVTLTEAPRFDDARLSALSLPRRAC